MLVLDTVDSIILGTFSMVDRDFVSFYPELNGPALLERSASAGRQEVFPVVDPKERLIGVVLLENLTLLAAEPHLHPDLVTAADLMRSPVSVGEDDNLRAAFDALQASKLRELPIIDKDGRVIGLIDEVAIAHAYLKAGGARPPEPPEPDPDASWRAAAKL